MLATALVENVGKYKAMWVEREREDLPLLLFFPYSYSPSRSSRKEDGGCLGFVYLVDLALSLGSWGFVKMLGACRFVWIFIFGFFSFSLWDRRVWGLLYVVGESKLSPMDA